VKLPDLPTILAIAASTLIAFGMLSNLAILLFSKLGLSKAAAVASRIGGFVAKALHVVEEAETVVPKPPQPPMMPPAVTSLFIVFAFALGLGFLATCSIGCKGPSGGDVLNSAVEVRNQIASVEVIAARELHTRCTMPMETISSEPEPARRADEVALAKKCDPLAASYDGERRSRMTFDDAITSFASGKVTVGDLLAMLSLLVHNAQALETEIVQ